MGVLCSGCSFSHVVGELDRESPPQELGRPGWVRYTARTGAWIGGFVGGIASLVTLPVTWPISLAADEPLGYAKEEFLFWGVSAGASGGHFLLGAPVDAADWMVRRAWSDPVEYSDYTLVPAVRPDRGGDASQRNATVMEKHDA